MVYVKKAAPAKQAAPKAPVEPAPAPAPEQEKRQVESVALAINPWVVIPDTGEAVKLSQVVWMNGWDNAKDYWPSVREFLDGLLRELPDVVG